VVGGQASRIPGVVYVRGDDGRRRSARAPITPAARLGLGAAIGYDFGRTTPAPVRVFVRYRQLAHTPFMSGNGLPVMGFADFSAGVAVALGAGESKR